MLPAFIIHRRPMYLFGSKDTPVDIDKYEYDEDTSTTSKWAVDPINYSEDVFKEVKDTIKGYLKVFTNTEAGVLVSWDGEVIPVKNTAKFKAACFEIRDKADLWKLFELYQDDNLFAIAHNHPHGLAIPSGIDINYHTLPCHMIIYSNLFDYLAIYPAQYLKDRKHINKEDFKHLTTEKQN